MENSLSKLSHLRSLAVKVRTLIADVAQATADALEEMDSTKADKPTRVNVTLTASGWADNTDTGIQTDYPKRYVLAVSEATDHMTVDCELTPSSIATAIVCGMCPSVTVTNGYITFYAMQSPASDLDLEYHLIPCKGV